MKEEIDKLIAELEETRKQYIILAQAPELQGLIGSHILRARIREVDKLQSKLMQLKYGYLLDE